MSTFQHVKKDLKAYRIAIGCDKPTFKTVKSRIYLEVESEQKEKMYKNFMNKYNRVLEELSNGYSVNKSCNIAGINVPTLYANMDMKQSEVIRKADELYRKRKSEGFTKRVKKELPENFEKDVVYRKIDEKAKQMLIDGEVQLQYFPYRKVIKYLTETIPPLFPKDPCRAFKKDTEAECVMYLKAFKRGYWQISDKKFNGVKVFQL